MSDGGAPGGRPLVRILDIVNKKGLHARASAKFVGVVEKHDAKVAVTRGSETVGGDSIMGLMMLGAGIGTQITVESSGAEAKLVMDALTELVTSRFGEEE